MHLMQYKYNYSVVGGTFDRFHIGHMALLDTAFSLSEKVGIGVATPVLYKNKYLSHTVEDYQARENAVKNYLLKQGLFDRATITPIDDIYGTTLSEMRIYAIIATEDNLENVEEINAKRIGLKLSPLQIEIVPFVLSDDGDIVSSERIRKGEIDREGNSFFLPFFDRKKYTVPEEMRESLTKPFGKLVKNISDIDKFIDERNMLFAIGDIIVINLFRQNLIADISIVDHKTRRVPVADNEKELLKKISGKQNVLNTENNPGNIERRAVGVIRKALEEYFSTKQKQTIVIDGEEDLLVLPIVALAPLESVVLYGQPDKGIVMIKVSEKKKKEVKYLLNRMR